MVSHKLRIKLKTALEKINNSPNKKELYRILKIGENYGFEWGQRTMYGGGTNIEIYDNQDLVAEIIIIEDNLAISFNDIYYDENYIPAEIIYFNDEQLAEIKNEEALYGYEMPHYKIIKGYIPNKKAKSSE